METVVAEFFYCTSSWSGGKQHDSPCTSLENHVNTSITTANFLFTRLLFNC